MSSNKTSSLLIFLLVVMTVVVAVLHFRVKSLHKDLGNRNTDLRRKDKQLELKIDSLQALRKQLLERERQWVLIMNDRRDSLRKATQQANFWRNKYNHDKNGPVIPYTPTELDSIISSIIR